MKKFCSTCGNQLELSQRLCAQCGTVNPFFLSTFTFLSDQTESLEKLRLEKERIDKELAEAEEAQKEFQRQEQRKREAEEKERMKVERLERERLQREQAERERVEEELKKEILRVKQEAENYKKEAISLVEEVRKEVKEELHHIEEENERLKQQVDLLTRQTTDRNEFITPVSIPFVVEEEKKVVEKKPDPVIEQIIPPVIQPIIEPVVELVDEPEVSEVPPPVVEHAIVAEPVVESIVTETPVTEPVPEVETETKTIYTPEPEPVEANNKGRWLKVALIVLIPTLAIGAAVYYFVTNSQKQMAGTSEPVQTTAPAKQPVVTSAPPVDTIAVADETIQQSDTVAPPPVTSTPTVSIQRPKPVETERVPGVNEPAPATATSATPARPVLYRTKGKVDAVKAALDLNGRRISGCDVVIGGDAEMKSLSNLVLVEKSPSYAKYKCTIKLAKGTETFTATPYLHYTSDGAIIKIDGNNCE